jgi:selenocysteine lyase/cysteine desulfurase
MSLFVLFLLVLCASGQTKFGHNLLPLFSLEKGYIPLNHGSFGTVPKTVQDEKVKWITYVEGNPDRWFRYECYPEMDKVRAVVAPFVGAKAEDVVFVENASHGVNAILRSLQIGKKAGTKILLLDVAYTMVKNTVAFLCAQYNMTTLQVHVPFPTTKAQIISLVEQTLNSNPDIAIASFSHIVAFPSMIMPVKEIQALCRARGVLVLIDGAHVMGQISLNITDIDPDFYVTNGYKWCFTPKGSAILYVRKDKQNLIYPTTISGEGDGLTAYQMLFSYEGTSDYSSYLAFPAAIQWRASFGEQQILDYIHNLAVQGGTLLADFWKTEKLLDDSLIGSMVNVRVPSTNATLMSHMPSLLLSKYNTVSCFFSLEGTNTWYIRVSAQIYNELSDFQYLGNCVNELIAQSYKY